MVIRFFREHRRLPAHARDFLRKQFLLPAFRQVRPLRNSLRPPLVLPHPPPLRLKRLHLKLLRRPIRQRFDRGYTGSAELLDQPITQARNILKRSRSLRSHRGHLLLDFLPLLFFALDVDLPAEQLRRQPNVLSLFADGKRELAVIDNNFKMLFAAVNHSHAADFGRLQRLLGKRDGIFMEFDDVDLLSAQFADDRLHAHSLHADASAYRVHVFVLRHDSDLGTLTSFTRDRPDHNGAVVDFRNLGLEQVLHQFRRRTRHNDSRSLGRTFHAGNYNAHTLANGKRLQTRLLLAGHARFSLADIENYIRTFDALHRRIDDLIHATDVFVVDRVAFGFAHLLENYLLRQLRRDASQNSFGHFRDLQLTSDFEAGINLARIFQRDLQVRIFHLLRSFNHGLDRERIDLAGILVQLGAEILLRLVVLARRHHDGVFDRADYNLGIDTFLPAQCVNRVVELASHKKTIW